MGELHPGRRHQHRHRLQHLHPAAVGGRPTGVQGPDRDLSGGIRPGSRTGQRLHQTWHQRVPRNPVRIPAQRQARRPALRLHLGQPQCHEPFSGKSALPPEPVRLHAGGPDSDSEDLQRKEPPVLHVELRGIQVPPDHFVHRHGADGADAKRRLFLHPVRRVSTGGPELPQPGRIPTSPSRYSPAIRFPPAVSARDPRFFSSGIHCRIYPRRPGCLTETISSA